MPEVATGRTLDRRRQGDDGKPDRLQARRRRRGFDLFRAEGGGEVAEKLKKA